MTRQKSFHALTLCCLLGAPLSPVMAEPANTGVANPDTDNAQELALRQQAIDKAGQSLDDAAKTLDEARQAIAASKADRQKDVALTQEELSRAHRELRQASREVARAHRALAGIDREVEMVKVIMGDQAIIGIVLGGESVKGIELMGVSPDGPAERAGLRQRDVLTAIGGVNLTGYSDGGARDALFAEMDQAEAGQELPVEVSRDGDVLAFMVVPEQREPSSWHSRVRLPALPPMPPVRPGDELWEEPIDAQDMDEEELAIRIQEITDRAKEFEYMFTGEDGETMSFSKAIEIDDGPRSVMGEHALDEGDIWFDLPRTRGLELASLNPQLGKYFNADKGVLVIEARADNAYGLESGDVINAIGTTAVNSPGDLVRALRSSEPGDEITLRITRDRKDRTLKATVPEPRIGLSELHRMRHRHRAQFAPPPPPPPEVH